MIRLDPTETAQPHSCASAFLADVPAERLSLPAEKTLSLARGIARYRLTAETISLRGTLSGLAYRWGWRFFLRDGDTLLPAAIDVRPGRDAGSWRAGLVLGPRIADQIAALNRISSEDRPVATLRILDAPGLDWSGVWLSGAQEEFLTLPSLRPANAARLLGRLRKRARLRRDGHLRHLSADSPD